MPVLQSSLHFPHRASADQRPDTSRIGNDSSRRDWSTDLPRGVANVCLPRGVSHGRNSSTLGDAGHFTAVACANRLLPTGERSRRTRCRSPLAPVLLTVTPARACVWRTAHHGTPAGPAATSRPQRGGVGHPPLVGRNRERRFGYGTRGVRSGGECRPRFPQPFAHASMRFRPAIAPWWCAVRGVRGHFGAGPRGQLRANGTHGPECVARRPVV